MPFAAGFDAFVTADQNLQFQQNLTGVMLAIVVIKARSNALENLTPAIPELLAAIGRGDRGEIKMVASPVAD